VASAAVGGSAPKEAAGESGTVTVGFPGVVSVVSGTPKRRLRLRWRAAAAARYVRAEGSAREGRGDAGGRKPAGGLPSDFARACRRTGKRRSYVSSGGSAVGYRRGVMFNWTSACRLRPFGPEVEEQRITKMKRGAATHARQERDAWREPPAVHESGTVPISFTSDHPKPTRSRFPPQRHNSPLIHFVI
jgi:hypothetical protein